MKCERCENEDSIYFYCDKGVYYCRKCIMFGRINVGEQGKRRQRSKKKIVCKYQLDYELTCYQKVVVKKLNQHLKKKQDVLVYAGTGCGKTEIVMKSIQDYLNDNKSVGIAISRRQVVLEIKDRMQRAFPMLKVIAVCEGYTRISEGDLIVCTMHQLYRYHEYFDLLIMDEIDAFPYYGNALLNSIAMHSCVGEIVYLSATPDIHMKKKVEQGELNCVELFVRPHGKPFIVPRVKKGIYLFQMFSLLYFLWNQKIQGKQTLVFMPTIILCKQFSVFFSYLLKATSFSSKSEEKESVIEKFRNHEYEVLFCTTVLERGITIKGVDVVVYHADHFVFNEASLIQIFGRVGRSMDIPYGNALLLCSRRNQSIRQCIQTLQTMNESISKG